MSKRIPLDDPRWVPMKEALEARVRQTGDMGIAVLDLAHAMRNGALRSMRRDLATGAGERIKPAFWRHGHVMPDTGCFFVWKPDLDVLLRALKR